MLRVLKITMWSDWEWVEHAGARIELWPSGRIEAYDIHGRCVMRL